MVKPISGLTIQIAILKAWTAKIQKKCYVILLLCYVWIVLSQQVAFLNFYAQPMVQDRILPILYLSVIAVYQWMIPKVSPVGQQRNQRAYVGWALFFATGVFSIKIIIALLMGLLGQSPYDNSLNMIVWNLFSSIPEILFREFLRFYGLGICQKKNRGKVFVSSIVIFTLLQIDYGDLFAVGSMKDALIFGFQTLVPLVVEQCLCNYFALLGGFAVNFGYCGCLKVLEWLFPVLPMLEWFAVGIIGIFVVGILCFILHSSYEKVENKEKKDKKESMVSTVMVLTICVLMIWFVAGVFPVYPSVVLTGSMEPGIMPGDIVLIHKFQSQDEISKVQIGDIVNFDRDDINITHRVLNIFEQKDGTMKYETKGDNNPAADSRQVEMAEMNGTVIATIPKIGLPVLWMKSSESEETGKEINGQ